MKWTCKDSGTNPGSMRRSGLFLLVAGLFLVVATPGFAQSSYTESTSVSGGGTLAWTVAPQNGLCGNVNQTVDEYFESFTYTPAGGGGATPLGGSIYYLFSCDAGYANIPGGWNGPGGTDNELSLAYGQCTIYFDAYDYGGGSASLSCPAPPPAADTGFINPKYVVVGVTYAPPGSSSHVEYTNTTSVGNTTTISNSFSNDAGFSISTAWSAGINAGWFGSSIQVTATESTDLTTGSSGSNTTTISKASTVAYQTNGTPTEAPVNSDYDYIWLWLNPELFITYTAPVGGNPGSVVLTGYGMDPNDPATGLPQSGIPYTSGPDIIEVQVGCLNGHFSCGSDLQWSNGEGPGSFVTSGLLARNWQSAANGYYWPAGEQAGLSFNDVCQILTFDPLAATPGQCPTQNDYTLLNSLPQTTSDGRFSKLPYDPPNPIQYPIGGGTESYNMVQTSTQGVSTGQSTQIKQAFSVSEQFKSQAFFGLVDDSTTFKESDTLTWNYSKLSTLTTSTSLTNALSITGPPDTPAYPSNQPVEFIGYQDNTFGTFLLVPVNYCPSATSILCTD